MTASAPLAPLPAALPPLPAGQWAALRAAYATPARAYHHVGHVEDVLGHVAWVATRTRWHRPAEVALAALYHDAILVPGRRDNEARSARFAEAEIARWLPHAGIDAARVAALIRMTVAHGRHAPASFGADRDADDARHFLDCDMAILAAPLEVFDAYDDAIAEEYRGRIPALVYRVQRRRFLSALMASDRIYLGAPFHEACDQRARDNLRRALDRGR